MFCYILDYEILVSAFGSFLLKFLAVGAEQEGEEELLQEEPTCEGRCSRIDVTGMDLT